MPDIDYQHPMQLMELLGLRGWEASQPRVYWGLRRPDGLPEGWATPNAGLGGAGWGYQGGYGTTTGGGGGFGTATGVGGIGAAPASFSSARFAGPDVGGAGAAEPGSFSLAGEGLNAQSPSLMDFLGSVTTMPTTALAGVFGQALYNGITGQPNKPITQANPFGLSSVLGSAFGGSGDRPGLGEQDFGSSSVNAGFDIARGDHLGAALDLIGSAPDVGGSQGGPDVGPTPGDPTGGTGPAGLFRGGPVTLDRLIGPNPPGPDDGFAALDAGEHVLTADEVRALGGHAGVMRLRDLLRR